MKLQQKLQKLLEQQKEIEQKIRDEELEESAAAVLVLKTLFEKQPASKQAFLMAARNTKLTNKLKTRVESFMKKVGIDVDARPVEQSQPQPTQRPGIAQQSPGQPTRTPINT